MHKSRFSSLRSRRPIPTPAPKEIKKGQPSRLNRSSQHDSNRSLYRKRFRSLGLPLRPGCQDRLARISAADRARAARQAALVCLFRQYRQQFCGELELAEHVAPDRQTGDSTSDQMCRTFCCFSMPDLIFCVRISSLARFAGQVHVGGGRAARSDTDSATRAKVQAIRDQASLDHRHCLASSRGPEIRCQIGLLP
jgi:hypothetical protein